MDPEIIIFVSILLTGSFVLVGMKLRQPKLAEIEAPRGVKKANEAAVMGHYKTLLEINEDQKVTIASLRGKSQRLQQLLDTDEELEPEQLMKDAMPLVQGLANQVGINPEKLQALLNTPEAQKWISNPKNLKKLAGYAPLLASFKNKQGSNELASIPTTDA